MAPPDTRPAPAAALVLATGFGIGLIPIAPGTFGSLLGVGLLLAVAPLGTPVVLAVLAATVIAGIWAAGRAEAHYGGKDPGRVVVDEIAGQWLALLFVPLTAATIAAGFVAFRLFDIVKPFPVRRAESLPGGSGIMADDLIAGLYANVAVQILIRVLPVWTGSSS